MGIISFAVNIGSHLGVPATGLVTEVGAGLQKGLDVDFDSHVSSFLLGCENVSGNSRSCFVKYIILCIIDDVVGVVKGWGLPTCARKIVVCYLFVKNKTSKCLQMGRSLL